MEAVLDSYFLLDGTKLNIVYRSSSVKSYVVVLETENDEHRDVAFFTTQKYAEQFSFSLIRSFTELAFS